MTNKELHGKILAVEKELQELKKSYDQLMADLQKLIPAIRPVSGGPRMR